MSFFDWFIYLALIVGNVVTCILNFSIQEYFWAIVSGILVLALLACVLDDLKDNGWRLL